MNSIKITVRFLDNQSVTEISGEGVEKAFEDILKNEIGYSLLPDGIAGAQGGFSEAEHIALKLGHAGFDVRLLKSGDNRLKEGTIRWLGY